MAQLLSAPGSTPERASPAPVVFSLHTPEAPATPLSATHAITQFTYAAETPIEQQLQKARDELAATQLTVMVRRGGGGGVVLRME